MPHERHDAYRNRRVCPASYSVEQALGLLLEACLGSTRSANLREKNTGIHKLAVMQEAIVYGLCSKCNDARASSPGRFGRTSIVDRLQVHGTTKRRGA